MFTFGRDFDADSRLSWVVDILRLNDFPSQKMHRLYEKGVEMEDEWRGFRAQHDRSAP